MKRSIKRIISFALMLSLLVGMMAGFGVSAAEEPTVEIVSKNVYYADTLRLMYAVKATEGYDVAVKIYNAEDELVGNGIAGDGEKVPKTVDIDGVSCLVFVSDFGVPAQDIDTELFAVAELSKDGAVVKASAPVKYSVLEYLYERLITDTLADAQKKMYKNLLAYADSADVFLNEDSSTDSIANYSYVTVTNGTVNEIKAGMYKVGTEISNLTTTFQPASGKVLAWQITEYNESKTQQKQTTVRASEFSSYIVTENAAVITATEVDALVVKTTGTLLTNINQLTNGTKIAIVAYNSEYNKAMGKQASNNRESVEIEKKENTIVFEDTNGVQIITVEKIDDVYYLCVGDNEYLYAAGGTSTKNNYLKKQQKNDTCQWTISVTDDGVVTIKAVDDTIVKNIMRYNAVSDLFSCYSSGQKDIAIYIINE